MLASLTEILDAHKARGTAAGAFTCYGLEVAAAALAAAEERESPGVVLLVSPQAFAAELGESLVATLLALGERSPVSVCVELDHASDLELIERALRQGVNAVMADGSKLPYAENLELAAAVVAAAEARGAQVEVELGHVAGDEELAAATRAESLTDPERARAFIADSGAACLAVSIGNVHGHYATEPRLDLELLERIGAAVAAPLSLHGASGLPAAMVRGAIDRGIAKLNVNTELRAAYLDALEAGLGPARDGLAVLRLGLEASTAVRATVGSKLDLFEAKEGDK